MSVIEIDYFNNKFSEIPPSVLKRATDVISLFPKEVKADITAAFEEFGPMEWVHKAPTLGHFFWGMGVRNMLRDAGLSDDLLPDGNWDDYYIQVIEYTLGLNYN